MTNRPLFNIRISAIKAKDDDNFAIMMGFARTDMEERSLRTNRKLVKTVDDIETVAKSIVDELTPQIKERLAAE